jgi:flagellin
MALSVLNNIASLTAQNELAITNNNLQNTLFQLSSGSRINSGADDPAGLSIADGLQANITALTQSAQNATNGVGQLQVADGALSQVTTLLNRAVTLATEAANGGLTTDQYGSITNEYSSILAEINRIGNATNFNGTSVFSATSAPNPNQVVTMATSNLAVGNALTNATETQVQLGNNTPYTFTAGQEPATLWVGQSNVTANTLLTTGQNIDIYNGPSGATQTTFTAQNQTWEATGTSGLSALASISAGDQIQVTSGGNPMQTITAATTTDLADFVASINTAGESHGFTAALNSSGNLQITSTGAGALTVAANGGLTTDLAAAGTSVAEAYVGNTVGNLMTAINGSGNGLTASISGNKLNITSSNGVIASITGTLNGGTSLLGNVLATNTVQDLINGINGSGLGVTASLVTSVSNPNQLVGNNSSLSAASTLAGTLTLVSGTESNGAYANLFTYTAASNTPDQVAGTAGNNTLQGLIDAVNSSGTPFHAFLDSGGYLHLTDSSYSGNIQASTNSLTGASAAPGTLAEASPVTQLEITDPQNRGDLAVSNNDELMGYVPDNSSGNPLEGANPDSFIAAPVTTGQSGANVFISDGEVTNPTYNTIKVQVGKLSTSQIGTNTSTLDSANLGNSSGAAAALTVINNAISDVAAMRGTIGAGINRLNSATNVINTQVQNLTSAQSSIQDANVGQVVASLSKYQILEQTGISALAQANQNQQAVLKLLG